MNSNSLLIIILFLISRYFVYLISSNSIIDWFRSIDISFVTIQTVIQIVTGSLFDPGGRKLYLIFRFSEVHTKQEMVGGCSSNLVNVSLTHGNWYIVSPNSDVIIRLGRGSWVKTLTLFNASKKFKVWAIFCRAMIGWA